MAAEFEVVADHESLMKTLSASGHVRVVTPHTSNYLILAPSNISSDKDMIQALLDVTCGRDESLLNTNLVSCPREGIRLRSPHKLTNILILCSLHIAVTVCLRSDTKCHDAALQYLKIELYVFSIDT